MAVVMVKAAVGETGNAGTANTGGGGGNAGSSASPYQAGGAGGSGVVILRYSNAFTISNPGGGLTISTTTDGDDKVSSITSPAYMAHYAFLDADNIVTEVIIGKDEGSDGIDWESHYSAIRGQAQTN